MAHSINTSGEIANNHTSEVHTPQVDTSTWRNPVLTVRSRDSENAETGREVRFLFTDDGIVVNPWGARNPEDRLDRDEGPYVQIHGEDLFALRELLAEIPEEAFIRPVDPPVESYCFMDGTDDFWVYSHHNDSWHCGRPLHLRLERDHPSAYKGFESWKSAVDSHGIQSEPEAEWGVGDIIIYHAPKNGWVFRREADGRWHRIDRESALSHDDAWADQVDAWGPTSTLWTVKRVTR